MRKKNLFKGVLQGFLGTYCSRYSEFKGQWLFGHLVEQLDVLEIDLLAPILPIGFSDPVSVAGALAKKKFMEQLRKANAPAAKLDTAVLIIEKGEPDERICSEGSTQRFAGHWVHLRVQLTFNVGVDWEAKETIFVAPTRYFGGRF